MLEIGKVVNIFKFCFYLTLLFLMEDKEIFKKKWENFLSFYFYL